MLKLKSVWHGGLFSVAALLLVAVVGINANQGQEAGAVGGSCGPDVTFGMPGTGDVVSGLVDLQVHVAPTVGGGATGGVAEVDFEAGNGFIDDGTENTTSIWEADWDTTGFANGAIQLRAKVYDFNGNIICISAPVDVDIQNTNTSGPNEGELRLVRIKPTVDPWIGVTNISKVFKVKAILEETGSTPQDVTSQTNFNWSYDGDPRGSLGSNVNGPQISYWTGGSPGPTRFIVDAQYQDLTDSIVFNVEIHPSSTSTTYPENPTLEDDDLDPIDPEELDDPTVPEGDDEPTPEELLSSDPELRGCLIDVVGEHDYGEITDGDRRLTFTELNNADQCFAVTRFVIPANIAPVEPGRIREVKEDARRARVDAVDQAVDGVKDQGFHLTGVALPNSTVVIYIFSEPLVLTTTADENGNWTYVLENPLEPGEHEVFVAVEDDEGEVIRSSGFTFNVAQAASIENNPSGLSLTLDFNDPSQNSTIYYVSAVVAVMLVGLSLYVFVIRRKGDFMSLDDEGSTSGKKDN